MATIDELIQQGNSLRGSRLGSPKYEMWENDLRALVAPYGEKMKEVLEHALWLGVIGDGDTTNDEQIDDAIEFLESLNERTVEESRAQDLLINQKYEEAKATLSSKFGNATVNGDATFGDNSSISKVTVSEFMSGLIQEVESMPDSDEKNKILESLKTVLANPTFATVSGSVVSEVLKHLMRG